MKNQTKKPETNETYYGKDGAEVLRLLKETRPTFLTRKDKPFKLTSKNIGDCLFEWKAALYDNIAHYFWLKKWGSGKVKINGSERHNFPYNPDLFSKNE